MRSRHAVWLGRAVRAALKGGPLRRGLLVSGLVVLLAAGSAGAALVEADGIVLHVKAGFLPHSLPRRHFASIDFQSRISISRKGGGIPPALQQIVVEFDRNGRFAVAGLPTCPPGRLAEAGTAQARAICSRALVGLGHLEAAIEAWGVEFSEGAPLTIFNGPRWHGQPTAVIHARFPPPVSQTLVLLVPIERLQGAFGYRATVQIPPIAGGSAAITGLDLKLVRRYRVHGRRRSYLSARCKDGIIETQGSFSFAGGAILEGQIEEPCAVR